MQLIRFIRAGTFVLSALSANSYAAPAHYIVFSADTNGFTPVFYTQVDMQSKLLEQSDASRALSGNASESDVIEALSVDTNGKTLAFQIDLETQLRAEFHGHDGGEIAGRHIEKNAHVFVVRLPEQMTGLKLSDAHSSQVFDLKALAASRDQLPLAGYAKRLNVSQEAMLTGDPANRLDVLIMGDGFTSPSTFDSAANNLRTRFDATSPYSDYLSFMNITNLYTQSAEAGADHPPYLAGCSADTCCRDIDALGDPLSGQYRNTAFDATYCAYQSFRIVTVDVGKLFVAAAANPEWDQIFVIVNDPTYGGSGGSVSVASTHPDAGEIAMHEFGHSLWNLADEYTAPSPGFPSCSDIPVVPARPFCEWNVTNNTDASSIKWREWFSGNPIPTPSGNTGIGLFLGARYLPLDMYRPANDCKMRTLDVPFCSICKQAFVLTMYGGFGRVGPRNGIQLIEPGSENPATGGTIQVTSLTTFQVSALTPTANTLQIRWLLDGNVIPGASAQSYALNPLTVAPGAHTLKLEVKDTTALVKPITAGNLLQASRTWNVITSGGVANVIFANGFE
jgi:hypothetical protein